MKHEAQLEAAAAASDIKVSYESLQASVRAGGLCRVRGEYRVIMDRRSQAGERVATLAQALSQFDLAGVELSPAARDLVRHYAVRRAS
jgi:hypothetical protein